jgi:hypothetical protein
MTFAEPVTDLIMHKPLRDKMGPEAEGSFDWLVCVVPLLFVLLERGASAAGRNHRG